MLGDFRKCLYRSFCIYTELHTVLGNPGLYQEVEKVAQELEAEDFEPQSAFDTYRSIGSTDSTFTASH